MKKIKKVENICSIKECDRPIYVKKHKLCHPHAMQYYRNGMIVKNVIAEKKSHKPFIAEK